MNASYIDYQETQCFSPTILRYLDHDPQLAPFLSHWPRLEGFSELLRNKPVGIDRTLLVGVLKEHYARSIHFDQTDQKVQQNIELLNLENTFTITTGHQLNLFTGPLYFIFKIVTTINLARELAIQFPEKNIVPIYWMASEDHDFAEINHTYIHGKKVVWEQNAHGATGQIDLSTIEQTVKIYTGTLGISEHAKELATLIIDAYTKHNNLADATRYLVHHLFRKQGLVILDANHPELKKEFSSIILRDIIEQNSFKAINQRNQKLNAIGIEAQVNPREINFFYLSDQLRERLIFKDHRYQVLNTTISFSEQELRTEIQNHPERFSPNVVMRPLYQEFILPNIAYVGGGAEIAYWLQLKQNFDHYEVNFPILILRNSALIISEKLGTKLKKLDLGVSDIFSHLGSLQKEWILRHTTHELNLNSEWQAFEAIFEKTKTRVSQIDTTLGPSTEAIKMRLHKTLQNLEKKLIKAEKRNHNDALLAIKNIKDELFPKGILQERSENFGSFYAKYGEHFIDSLIESFKPLDFKFTILREEGQVEQ